MHVTVPDRPPVLNAEAAQVLLEFLLVQRDRERSLTDASTDKEAMSAMK